MTAYYNEIEPFAAQWLRNLIKAGHIAHGDVDDRSIAEVQPADLAGYRQCHFFAGIGVWSLALRWAGWPDDREVWTGSCPCQPFSSAGKQAGFADPRHLWPYWYRLIDLRRPAVVFGEQVASASKWLALVRSDLEALEYAVGCLSIEAASVGALHKRDRFWFVADANSQRIRQQQQRLPGRWTDRVPHEGEPQLIDTREVGHAAHAHGRGREVFGLAQHAEQQSACGCFADGLGETGRRNGPHVAHAACERRRQAGRDAADSPAARGEGAGNRFSDASAHVADSAQPGQPGQPDDSGRAMQAGARRESAACVCGCGERAGNHWRTEPGVGRLANGAPARVGRLRAYGNAIVPQVAAEFIAAYMECAP